MQSFETSFAEYSPEAELFESGAFEFGEMEAESVFSEAEQMQLAAELLEINTEAELDRFLGGLIKKAGQAVGKFVKSPVGQALGGVLKAAAKKALPIAGGALGAWVGGPLGAKIGSGLASAAGKAMGLELESLSQEDREFEGAKQFVRFAGDAVKNAVTAPPSDNPASIAQAAAMAAARKLAPGLIGNPRTTSLPAPHHGRTGRWMRRGRNIVIINC